MEPFDVEKFIEKTKRDPHVLGTVCTNLAIVLSGGTWDKRWRRSVELNQMNADQIGEEIQVGDKILDAILHTTRIRFEAAKAEGEDANGNSFDVNCFRLSTEVRQNVQENEVPKYLLAEIREDFGDGDLSLDPHEADSVMETIDWDNLDEVEIEREMFIEYEIDQDGEIEEYTLMHTYYMNSEEVHQTSYSTKTRPEIFSPKSYSGSDAVSERRPRLLGMLRPSDIEREAKNIDASWEEFLLSSDVMKALELGGGDIEQHTKRALGMLGMLLTNSLYPIDKLV